MVQAFKQEEKAEIKEPTKRGGDGRQDEKGSEVEMTATLLLVLYKQSICYYWPRKQRGKN